MDVFDETHSAAAHGGEGCHVERAEHPMDAERKGHIDDVTAFVTSVNRWAADADQAADEHRVEAALRIQQCWETDAPRLDLRNLNLSTLPAGLWMLNLPYAGPRNAAPDTDQSDQWIRHREGSNGGPVGTRLRQLLLDGNRLRVLPERIASLWSLRHLSIAHNRLTGLPDGLKRLPALSYLNVGANDLEALPDALGEMGALEVLRADGCLLRWIPPSLAALPSLRELDVSDNVLTSLPDAIRWLPTSCVVRLHDNPLPERVRRALREGPAAPIWMFEDTAPLRFSRTLDEAAFAWLIMGADRCRASLDTWRHLAEGHPDVAWKLARLLDALGTLPEASNSDTRFAFRAGVRDTLKQIEADASGLLRAFAPRTNAGVPAGSGGAGADGGAHARYDDIGGVDAAAHTAPDENAGWRDAQTRAQWARVAASLTIRPGVADNDGATDRRPDADAARSDRQRDPVVVTAPILDEAREQALRYWIDRYVLAHPLLDCADVLHACRMAIDHSDRYGTSLPLPSPPARSASAQRGRSTEPCRPTVPALQAMSAGDLADCLRAVPPIDGGGHRLARNRAECGNDIG